MARILCTMLAALVALGLGPAAHAQSITNHSIPFYGRDLAYTATAGLMPIRSADGASLVGDMSYVA
jgi:carboxypeptidase C (cathepsin A)